MYKQLTVSLLHYLLDNHFDSPSDMARQFDMTDRHIRRIIKDGAEAKGGTVALDKALCYCAQNHISLDIIVDEIMNPTSEHGPNPYGHPAYENLRIVCPDHLSAEGIDTYHSMLRFLQKVSAKVCPTCEVWCNPWSGQSIIEEKDCFVGHIAQEIIKSLKEIYSEEGTDP